MAAFTWFLTVLIIAIIFILLIYFIVRPTYKTISNAPSILTSIGIFGTFLGIAIGLVAFNPENIERSVPNFLNGISLAFWSSVAGIFAAIIHKLRFVIFPSSRENDSGDDERDIIRQMIGALKDLRDSFNKQDKLIDKQLETSRLISLESRKSFTDDISKLGKALKLNDQSDLDKTDSLFSKTALKLDDASNKFADIIEAMSSNYSASNEKNFAKVVGKLGDVSNRFDETMNRVNDSLGGRFETGMLAMGDGLEEKLQFLSNENRDDRARNTAELAGRVRATVGQQLMDSSSDREYNEDITSKQLKNLAKAMQKDSSAERKAAMDFSNKQLKEITKAMTESLQKDSSAERKAAMDFSNKQLKEITEAMQIESENQTKNFLAAAGTQDANLTKALGNLQEQLKENAKSRDNMEKQFMRQSNESTTKLATLAKQLREDALKDQKAALKMSKDQADKIGDNFEQLIDANQEVLDAELKALEQQLANKSESDERFMEMINGNNEASSKSMLRMLKQIVDTTLNSNNKITAELGKLRQDVSAEYKATTNMTDMLLKQLRAMSEAYKTAVLASTAELKAQMSKDMRDAHKITEKNQLASLDRLEGVANIMEGVVASSSDIGSLMHENSNALKGIKNAFTGTNQGSIGRFMAEMNEKTLNQLKTIEDAFTAQGSMGRLMVDMNDENIKQLRMLDKSFSNGFNALNSLPREIAKLVKSDVAKPKRASKKRK